MRSPKPNQSRHVYIPVRTDENLVARLDALSAWLVRSSPGMIPKRSYGCRAAFLRGLAAFEAEMAAEERNAPRAPSKPRKKRPVA